MNDTIADAGMLKVHERLAGLEERGRSRDEAFAAMRVTIEKMDAKIDLLADDVKTAKVGLRFGMWLASTLVPAVGAVAGWFAHTFWGK